MRSNEIGINAKVDLVTIMMNLLFLFSSSYLWRYPTGNLGELGEAWRCTFDGVGRLVHDFGWRSLRMALEFVLIPVWGDTGRVYPRKLELGRKERRMP